ncbi:hypothetical protein AABB24_033260 [Solanum stoloniferum]|uniref:Uncharacterized protein n=1 Tax=Solanum stoloniferum TaxID=62892 RepID=A0ABD2RMI2_9SOLN
MFCHLFLHLSCLLSSQFAISQRLMNFISWCSTLWVNRPSIGSNFSGGILNYTPIVLEGNARLRFLYGFYCNFYNTECFLGISLVLYNSTGETIYIEGGQFGLLIETIQCKSMQPCN